MHTEHISTPTNTRKRAPLIALVLAMILTLVAFDRPLVRGDGVAYLAWIDTLVLDQDVNFNNQHDRLRPVITYQIEWDFERERWVNIFPFGIAFLQAPFYAIGSIFQSNGWLDLNPDYFHQMQGVGLPYSFWLMVGANVMAVVAAMLAWLVGIRLCDRWTAALAAYATFLGTPLFYYSTISPVNSHNAGAFTAAAMICLLAVATGGLRAETERNTTPHWLAWVGLGVFAGLTVLARWQLLLVVIPVWALLVYERRWRGLVIATLAAGITLLPLPLIWQEMFGAPLLVPFDAVNDEAFIQTSNHSLDVLRETLLHSPVVLISLLGIPALWRVSRRWALLAASIIILQLVVNGAALDWNAGESYGMRRMSEIYIIYALLVCAALGQAIAWGKRRGWQWTALAVRGVMVVLAGYTFLYIAAFLNFTWTNQGGAFNARPDVMIRYFFDQQDHWWILWEVYRTHVGPLAWSMPGP